MANGNASPDSNVSLNDDVFTKSTDDIILETKSPKARANWGSQLEFLLTCVGFAVGLGNLWRFPYLAYRNGGGAFLIPYAIMLFCVGMPLFYMELAFGQFASLGPITIWKINGLFKGAGWASILVTFCVALYYNVIIAYCIYYFCASMTASLPWESCGHEWNTPNCSDGNVTMLNSTADALSNKSHMMVGMTKPTEEYFYNHVLAMSNGIDESGKLRWQLAVCLLVAWTLVFCVLFKGIKSLGKVMYFAAVFPYILLTILLVRGVTLEGSGEGIRYYLTPDWHRLMDSRVWSDAAVQIFYSLGCCCGGNIAMASFNKFSHNCRRDAMLVPIINCATSVFAGFVVFSMLGFMANEKGVPVAEVAQGGPGLVFVVYPEGISKMPLAPLWSIVFFLMMMILGFSSQFSLVETVISAIADEYKNQLRDNFRKATAFRAILIISGFLLGLPMCLQSGMYLLNLVDANAGGYPLLVIGIVEVLSISWIYGYKRFGDDIQMMLGVRPGIYWRITWCLVSPAILLATFIFLIVQYEDVTYGDYAYPPWALGLGWIIGCGPIALIVGWALIWYCRYGGAKLFIQVSNPLKSWGPALPENRLGIYQTLRPPSGGDRSASNSPSALSFSNGAFVATENVTELGTADANANKNASDNDNALSIDVKF